MTKPDTCPICKSQQVVPVIYGSPMPELFDIELLGKVVLAGCDAIQVGDPLWQCVECNESLSGPMAGQVNHGDMQAYQREIAMLLSTTQVLSAEERASWSGRGWLSILVRNYLGRDALPVIYVRSDGHGTYCSLTLNAALSEDGRIASHACFRDMQSYLDANRSHLSISTHYRSSRITANASIQFNAITIVRTANRE